MLEPAEKAYCQALESLEAKQYQQAVRFFDQAAGFFGENQEFNLLAETTRLLVELKKEIAAVEKTEEAQETDSDDDTLIIKEKYTDGQETILP